MVNCIRNENTKPVLIKYRRIQLQFNKPNGGIYKLSNLHNQYSVIDVLFLNRKYGKVSVGEYNIMRIE